MTSITRHRGIPAGSLSMTTVGEWLRSPVAPYYLILASATMLAGLGLVMVLSASSVSSYAESGSSYTVFLNQLTYAGIGVLLAVIGSRLPPRWWRRLAWPAILLALALQAAVMTGLGADFQGNRNAIVIANRALQPAEFGKLALVVFGAAVLASRRRVMHKVLKASVPLLPVGGALVALVLAGHDLGTAMILVAILVGLLWSAGLPGRWFLGVGAVATAAVLALALGSANRMQRIQVWLGSICDGGPHVEGCFQKVHAEYALADGGWWGLGLGESREKWGLLPEPHNDFILAIIGEELGLPGSLAVLLLFAVLAYACFRIVSQAEDTFTRLAASGVMIWLLAQAVLNIGSVIGMLPIIGVPLPLVSSGGTALIAALIGVGLLLSLARSLPGAREALGGRTSTLRRTFAAVPSTAWQRTPLSPARPAVKAAAGGRTARPARGTGSARSTGALPTDRSGRSGVGRTTPARRTGAARPTGPRKAPRRGGGR